MLRQEYEELQDLFLIKLFIDEDIMGRQLSDRFHDLMGRELLPTGFNQTVIEEYGRNILDRRTSFKTGNGI